MQTDLIPVYARDHTLLGVCEALGEDIGFNPVYLRILLSVGLFFSPWGALALYAGLGLLVAFTRFVAPNPRAPVTQADSGPVEANSAEAPAEPELALAA
jgi:phage shock protein PspC (stress-responsive transcriptional regulator)